MPKIIGENIDTLCNFQMLPGSGDLTRGETQKFYKAARQAQKDPLTYLAATALAERVKPGDNVLIVTGARNELVLPYGETDGPIGGVALARACYFGLGANSIVTVEESNKEPTEATIRASGLYLREPDMLGKVQGICVLDFYPLGPEAGKQHARWLMDTYNPKAIMFIEKHGPNAKGHFHTVTGREIDMNGMANTQYLLEIAKEQDVVTIGMGDGGNEIGNGVIYDAVREISPWGKKCLCPCNDGIATVSATDIFVATSISNWGAYGICAMLAFLKKDVNIMHDEDTERRMVEACAYFGSVDGIAMIPLPKVDGISIKGGQAFVTLLRELVVNGLSNVARHV
ncbi:MAG: DUF4392 domain-containing protein [Clostridiales bacterium]|jgi:hypothetical protein|nr:DUF4392 domain-containing protein [Clostridiales bacterium]